MAGKTKKIAGTDKDPLVVSIPEVLGIAIVAVEPKLRIVTLHVEHFQIAVRVENI